MLDLGGRVYLYVVNKAFLGDSCFLRSQGGWDHFVSTFFSEDKCVYIEVSVIKTNKK